MINIMKLRRMLQAGHAVYISEMRYDFILQETCCNTFGKSV